MPNILRTQWELIKKNLSDTQKHFKDQMTGESLHRAQLVKEMIGRLPTGIGDMLDDGNKLFKAGNKGRELQQKCGQIYAQLERVQQMVHTLEGQEGIGDQHLGTLATVRTSL